MNIFDSLPEDIRKNWEHVRPMEEVLPELQKKSEALKSDPLFYADYLKAEFAIAIANAMEEKKLNKNKLAEKLGLSRQYVGRVLNENANFTIETMAAFALALGMKVDIKLSDAESMWKSNKREFIQNKEQELSEDTEIIIQNS